MKKPIAWAPSVREKFISDIGKAAGFGSPRAMMKLSDAERITEQHLEFVASNTDQIRPEDYIIAVGDVALLSVAISKLLMRDGKAHLLRWDNVSRRYEPFELKA